MNTWLCIRLWAWRDGVETQAEKACKASVEVWLELFFRTSEIAVSGSDFSLSINTMFLLNNADWLTTSTRCLQEFDIMGINQKITNQCIFITNAYPWLLHTAYTYHWGSVPAFSQSSRQAIRNAAREYRIAYKLMQWLAHVGILIDVSVPELMRSLPVSIRLWIVWASATHIPQVRSRSCRLQCTCIRFTSIKQCVRQEAQV